MMDMSLDSFVRSRISGFIEYLRETNFQVSLEDSILIGQTLEKLSFPNPVLTKHMCRAICCQTQIHWREFDHLFEKYWFHSNLPHESDVNDAISPDPGSLSKGPGGLTGMSTGSQEADLFAHDNENSPTGAGRQTTVAKADFRFLKDAGAMKRIEILTERLAKQIRPRISRRREISGNPGRIALGPTLKASIKTGGVPLLPVFTKRKHEPPHLVVLHDVSHSMTFNNPLLFRFTRGLIQHFDSAEAFIFHMHLYQVTPILREPSISKMQERLEQNNRMWFGGTCIADSLQEFRIRHSKKRLKSESTVIIISDGIDSNESQKLTSELTLLKQRCRRIFWLNPMLERPGFNIQKEAVLNVKRNVDFLLPAHSLDALQRCTRALMRC